MYDWTGSGLPSLAHPSYPGRYPRHGPLVPSFPEIRADWNGFSLPHLNFIGLNHSIRDDLLYDLVYTHEIGHHILADSNTGRIRRWFVLHMWNSILDLALGIESPIEEQNGYESTFSERRPPVLVPLRPVAYPSGNHLENLWHIVVALQKDISVVEEVYAVWLSLAFLSEEERISASLRHEYTESYKKLYGTAMKDFSKTFDTFDGISRRMPESHATMLVRAALDLPNDNLARFKELIHAASLVKLPPRRAGTDSPDQDLREHLLESAYHYVMNAHTSQLTERDRHLLSCVAETDTRTCDEGYPLLSQAIGGKQWTCAALLAPPELPVPSVFTHDGLFIHGDSIPSPDEYPDFIVQLSLESARQQLTQGVGLRCPLWTNKGCCGLYDLWNGIWQGTDVHQGTAGSWKRHGCLME